MESRHGGGRSSESSESKSPALDVNAPPLLAKGTELPPDYLKMVSDLFQTHFDEGLKVLATLRPDPKFIVKGLIMTDEIVLAASIAHPQQLAATTVYASVDFDPKASAPTAEDLLGGCVDALGQVFLTLLDPKTPDRIAQLAHESLSALERAPFEWTLVPVERYKVYVKIDKANLGLEALADDWLKKNDPEFKGFEEATQKETEKLFVTGEATRKSMDTLADGQSKKPKLKH